MFSKKQVTKNLAHTEARTHYGKDNHILYFLERTPIFCGYMNLEKYSTIYDILRIMRINFVCFSSNLSRLNFLKLYLNLNIIFF